MTWGDIKKGDAVIEVYAPGGRTSGRSMRSVVHSVGKKWITTRRADGGRVTKYSAETGWGEFGWRLHTGATLADEKERDGALATIRRYAGHYGPAASTVSTRALVTAARVLRDDATLRGHK